MEHKFLASFGKPATCAHCGYEEISHDDRAVCESCGKETTCELFPDLKHPKKMLLCPSCKQKEYDAAARATAERVASHEVIKTPGDYFNADIAAIKDIKESIEADPTVENKAYKVGEAVKLRLNHIKSILIERRNEVSALEREQRETQIFLNHHMKLLSEAQQAQLGLLDIKYKPSIGGVSKAPKKAPSVKKFDKSELVKYANMYNLDVTVLQMVVTRRQVSVEQAAKICIATNNKMAEAGKA